MATTPAKDTAPDATAPDEAPETPPEQPPADPPADPPATDPAEDAAAADPPAADESDKDAPSDTEESGSTLVASISGNLITLNGNGFVAGKKYDVRFQRPDGSIDNTVAVAQDNGALQTYATVKATGKHLAWLELAGEKIAELKFKV